MMLKFKTKRLQIITIGRHSRMIASREDRLQEVQKSTDILIFRKLLSPETVSRLSSEDGL